MNESDLEPTDEGLLGEGLPAKTLTPEEILARVLHRDGLMLVIDKPPGLYLSSFRCMSALVADAVARYCARMREQHGATLFEGKLTLGDPALEIAAVKAIRKATGG